MSPTVEKKTSRYSPEFRERAVRLLDENRSDYADQSRLDIAA
ncbi:hypothetical protein [Komagataeibacter xylinus]|nr:hypothetical protein [Komagataeibacter xylinus]